MKNSTIIRLRVLKHFHRKVRKMLKKKQGKRKKRQRTRQYTIHGKLTRFLNDNSFPIREQKTQNGHVRLPIPRIFSFTKNPEQTILFLKQIFYYGQQQSVKSIEFDHSTCEELGICASTVMDVLLLEIKENKQRSRDDFKLSGVLPKKGKARDILEVSGILKHLGFETKGKDHITKLELSVSEHSSEVAVKVADYYDRCLKTQSFSLTKQGRNAFTMMIGEIIDNCELHGGPIKKWYALGHYQLLDAKDYGECHLVIFNFGRTIYQSLKSTASSKTTRNSLNALSAKHRRFFNSKWNEESLWTLCALQEGVSRFRDGKEQTRGQGTINLINSFQFLGQTIHEEFPLMSITSGRAFIFFDNKYRLQNVVKDGETRRVIAFNRENDLTSPPDSNNVRVLQHSFPGTLISIKFFIDRNHIQHILGGNSA